MKPKKRICPDCGARELDKYQKKCAECREATRLYYAAITEHNYRLRHPDWQRTPARRAYMREYMRARRAAL